MAYESSAADALVGLRWLRDRPSVAERVRGRAEVSGKALPDALLEDPTHLSHLLAEAVAETVRSDVPPGVAEQLVTLWRFSVALARGFDEEAYVARELAAMQGLRSVEEFDAALTVSAEKASDEIGRAAVERMRAAADRAIDLGPRFLGPDGTGTDSVVVTEPEPGVITVPTLVVTKPTDPGVVDGATVDVTVPSGEAGVALSGDLTVDLAAQLGAIVGGHVGGAAGATQGAAIGAEMAASGAHPAPSHSTASNLWTAWGSQLGGAVGAAILGPAGQLIGSEFGGMMGGQMSGHGHDAATIAVDLVSAAACVLCGAVLCMPCVLAAEGVGDWLVSHIKALFD